MADIVVLGGGPTGVATAILLAQQGLNIVVLDRDQAPPDDPEEAWESWQRRSVGQFRLVHFVQPGGAGDDGAAPPGGLHRDGGRWRHPVQRGRSTGAPPT